VPHYSTKDNPTPLSSPRTGIKIHLPHFHFSGETPATTSHISSAERESDTPILSQPQPAHQMTPSNTTAHIQPQPVDQITPPNFTSEIQAQTQATSQSITTQNINVQPPLQFPTHKDDDLASAAAKSQSHDNHKTSDTLLPEVLVPNQIVVSGLWPRLRPLPRAGLPTPSKIPEIDVVRPVFSDMWRSQVLTLF
jgi:hypothetical protein